MLTFLILYNIEENCSLGEIRKYVCKTWIFNFWYVVALGKGYPILLTEFDYMYFYSVGSSLNIPLSSYFYTKSAVKIEIVRNLENH